MYECKLWLDKSAMITAIIYSVRSLTKVKVVLTHDNRDRTVLFFSPQTMQYTPVRKVNSWLTNLMCTRYKN